PAGASQTVTWSTSDAAIATVNDTGLVTGVAVGTATITATSTADPTKTDTCAITVTA
ncbi:TPA: Ig-like domain-containing protein, partial [Pseudomonas aeruginosa]|nr:Ig-like domain-containing protein [Pseudomonas aeruginosa]